MTHAASASPVAGSLPGARTVHAFLRILAMCCTCDENDALTPYTQEDQTDPADARLIALFLREAGLGRSYVIKDRR